METAFGPARPPAELPEAPPPSLADESLKRARLGALIFAAGAVLAAAVYFTRAPSGAYFASAGLIAFGALKVAVNVLRWLTARKAAGVRSGWRAHSTAMGITAIGLLALAGIGYTEYEARQELAAWNSWIAALEEHDDLRDRAYAIGAEFGARPGIGQQDIEDAERIAALYERAALTLDAVPRVPAGVAGHRATITQLERDFADSFRHFADAAARGVEADMVRHLRRAGEIENAILEALERYNLWARPRIG